MLQRTFLKGLVKELRSLKANFGLLFAVICLSSNTVGWQTSKYFTANFAISLGMLCVERQLYNRIATKVICSKVLAYVKFYQLYHNFVIALFLA